MDIFIRRPRPLSDSIRSVSNSSSRIPSSEVGSIPDHPPCKAIPTPIWRTPHSRLTTSIQARNPPGKASGSTPIPVNCRYELTCCQPSDRSTVPKGISASRKARTASNSPTEDAGLRLDPAVVHPRNRLNSGRAGLEPGPISGHIRWAAQQTWAIIRYGSSPAPKRARLQASPRALLALESAISRIPSRPP